MNYQPDMIVWLTTLRSFPRDQQLVAPLVQHNANRVRHVFGQFGLNYPPGDSRLASPGLLERSIVGQRRTLADWLRLQLYGVMWGITGIDQDYPDAFERPTSDFDADQSWESYQTPQSLSEEDLAFDVLEAGHDLAGNIPVLMVNEPIFISDGENSDLRYNLWYPRWAYDAYRAIYQEVAARQGWAYVDLWDMMDRHNLPTARSI